MNSHKLYFPAIVFLLVAMPVRADVMYQCVDESGHKSFSNIKSSVKGSRCIAMDIGTPAVPAASSAKAAAKAPTPASFPKVDESAQKARDTDRRRILESELAAEQMNLEQARKQLAAQEESALPEERIASRQHCTTVPLKDGKTGQSCTPIPGGINSAKVEERLQPFRDKVALHERNIEAIQKELSKLR